MRPYYFNLTLLQMSIFDIENKSMFLGDDCVIDAIKNGELTEQEQYIKETIQSCPCTFDDIVRHYHEYPYDLSYFPFDYKIVHDWLGRIKACQNDYIHLSIQYDISHKGFEEDFKRIDFVIFHGVPKDIMLQL